MSQAIEALLRACDELASTGRTTLEGDIADVLAAAAAVRAELTREPVELTDEQLRTAYLAAYRGGHGDEDAQRHTAGLRAVAAKCKPPEA